MEPDARASHWIVAWKDGYILWWSAYPTLWNEYQKKK